MATRRWVLGGLVAATVWRLAPARAGSPVTADDGFTILEAAPAKIPLAAPPAEPAEGLAWSGSVPGPLLRIRKGEDLKIRLRNGLVQPTMLCFPGLRPPNAAAGYGGLTSPRLAPGASAEIRFTPPDAGFSLYFPHAGNTDAAQQGRGLFGPVIVDETEKPDIDDDFAIVLSDWNVDDKGQIRDDFSDPALARGAGRKPGLVFANAAAAPLKLAARPGARVRLRLGNASTARLTNVGVTGAEATIVAVDGQPNEPFPPLRNQFPMGPGARFELMFDMPRSAGAKVALALREGSDGTETPLVDVVADGELVPARSSAPRLMPNPLLPAEIALETGRRTDIVLAGGGAAPFALNGVTFADWAPKPVASLARNSVTVFAIANRTAFVQAMRLGGHSARLLHSMDDGWEPYWRDTILVQPGRTASVAFVADNPGKWPIESSIPEHRAAGVGGWFRVE